MTTRAALWIPVAVGVLGMWALGAACYHDIYLTSIDHDAARLAKWDVMPLVEERRTDKWETLSILSVVVPALLCFVGPFVGALWSRAESRPAMLAGMTGAFFGILGFPAPLGVIANGNPQAWAAGVLFLIAATLPFAAACGAAGGLAGAAIRRRSVERDAIGSFVRDRGETPLQGLARETAILVESLHGSTTPLRDDEVTLVFAWVECARGLPDADRSALADLGLEPAVVLSGIEDANARTRVVEWLRHFQATLQRGDGKVGYR